MSKWAWSRGRLRRLAAVAAVALAWSAGQPAATAVVGGPTRRPEPCGSPLFARSVRAALTRAVSAPVASPDVGPRRKGTVRLMQEVPPGYPEAVPTLAGAECVPTAQGTACLPATLAGAGCLVVTADPMCAAATTAGAECAGITSQGAACAPSQTVQGTTCLPATLGGPGCLIATAEPMCGPATTVGTECAVVTSQGAVCPVAVTLQGTICIPPTLGGSGCILVTAEAACQPATSAGAECAGVTSQGTVCPVPVTVQGTSCIPATLFGGTCAVPATALGQACIPPTAEGACITVAAPYYPPPQPQPAVVYTVGCVAPVGPEWLLHLRAMEAGQIGKLSPTPGEAEAVVPLGSAQWMVDLGGPIVGSPYRWRFFLRSLTQQSVEVKARLLWTSPIVSAPPKELAAWAVGDIRPWSRDEPLEAYIKEGIATGLDLLNAVPGDQVILELTAPAGADGKAAVEIVLNAPDGAAGDSFVTMTTGPPVVLAVEPASLEIPVGKGQAFRAVVRVGDAPPVERAVVQWILRPTDAPASITPDGVLSVTGEGKFQVVALYQGMEAAADVAAVKAAVLAGDVNGDGKLSISDAILALRAVVNLVTLDPQAISAADLNRNGRLDIGDVVSMLRRIVGLS